MAARTGAGLTGQIRSGERAAFGSPNADNSIHAEMTRPLHRRGVSEQRAARRHAGTSAVMVAWNHENTGRLTEAYHQGRSPGSGALRPVDGATIGPPVLSRSRHQEGVRCGGLMARQRVENGADGEDCERISGCA